MADPLLTDDRWLRANGLFVAEGRFVVGRLIGNAGWRVRALFLTPAAHATLAASIDALPESRRPSVTILSAAELDEAGGFRFHQGCLAHAERPATGGSTLDEAIDRTSGPMVVLDHVRDPDNVGAIFRSALAFGAGAVVLGPGCADPLYRKTVRTSMAAVLSVPFATVDDTGAALLALASRGVVRAALTPAADAEALPDLAPRLAGRRVAVIAGTEGEGLPPALMAVADRRVRVPMAAGVDSLNVATAVAVTLYALAHTPAE